MYDPLVQGQFKLWPSVARSQIQINDPLIQGQLKNQVYGPLILVQGLFKLYDPLVTVQGQNEEQRPSCLSTRSVQKSILTTLLSQYKVKMRNN